MAQPLKDKIVARFRPGALPADWVGPTSEALTKRRTVLTLKRRVELKEERIAAMKHAPWMADKLALVEVELAQTLDELGALTQ